MTHLNKLKSATFSTPKVYSKLHSKLRISRYFFKKWLKIWRKNRWSSLFRWNRSNCTYFSFLHATSFVIGENFHALHGWRKIVFVKSHLYVFSPKHFKIFFLLQPVSRVGFSLTSPPICPLWIAFVMTKMRFCLEKILPRN